MKEELSREQSLKIIESMIGTARKNIVDNGFSWLIWGTLIFFGYFIEICEYSLQFMKKSFGRHFL